MALTTLSNINDNLQSQLPTASVIRVVARPWVFGIKDDSQSTVTLKSAWTLMDAGANICLTGDLSILADVLTVPPLLITVALNGKGSTFDDCCTKMGYISLPLMDGSIHWQQCFYSATTVETIVSPQATLATSNVFASWTMTGYKNLRPGAIQFDSHNGFLSMIIKLECHDGLYYCPTNVFALGHCPSTHRTPSNNQTSYTIPVPKIHWVHNHPPNPVLQQSS
jgi:hypothetical protein